MSINDIKVELEKIDSKYLWVIGVLVVLLAFGGGSVGRLFSLALIYGSGIFSAILISKQVDEMPALWWAVIGAGIPFTLNVTGIGKGIVDTGVQFAGFVQTAIWFILFGILFFYGYKFFNKENRG